MIVIISYDTDKARQKYRRNFFMAIIKEDQFVFHLICFSYDTGFDKKIIGHIPFFHLKITGQILFSARETTGKRLF